jgi:hypothetical protein
MSTGRIEQGRAESEKKRMRKTEGGRWTWARGRNARLN